MKLTHSDAIRLMERSACLKEVLLTVIVQSRQNSVQSAKEQHKKLSLDPKTGLHVQ